MRVGSHDNPPGAPAPGGAPATLAELAALHPLLVPVLLAQMQPAHGESAAEFAKRKATSQQFTSVYLPLCLATVPLLAQRLAVSVDQVWRMDPSTAIPQLWRLLNEHGQSADRLKIVAESMLEGMQQSQQVPGG